MPLRVVSMAELRLEVLLQPERWGESVTACRPHGISRQSYYRYRRRYLAEGPRWLASGSPRVEASRDGR